MRRLWCSNVLQQRKRKFIIQADLYEKIHTPCDMLGTYRSSTVPVPQLYGTCAGLLLDLYLTSTGPRLYSYWALAEARLGL